MCITKETKNKKDRKKKDVYMDWDVWGLPLVVLGTSVVIGIFVAFRDEDKSVRKDRNSR